MSIKNGVNEVFIQKVSLIFETSKGEEVTEVWNFVKNENIQPKTYDFVEFLNLDGFYDCKDLNELKNKFQATIQNKVEEGFDLKRLENDGGEQIVATEEQKKLLEGNGLSSVKEMLILSFK